MILKRISSFSNLSINLNFDEVVKRLNKTFSKEIRSKRKQQKTKIFNFQNIPPLKIQVIKDLINQGRQLNKSNLIKYASLSKDEYITFIDNNKIEVKL